jgi:copper chaperone NosL
MHLVAPQYSDGLDLYIFPYKIEGGGYHGQHLAEINNLNHYIGMKPIQEADFLEMRWMPFVFGLIILMTLRSIVFGEMSNVVDLFAVYSYFGTFSIGSFWYRLYEYGHNLEPHAPVHIQPFTPLLIGVKQIANFREYSFPQAGAYLLCVSVALILLAGWSSRKEQPA